MSDREFDALAETAVESRVWAVMRATANAWAAAWAHSAAVREIRKLVQPMSGWSEAERVRCAAMAVASATLVHLGLLALVPAYVVPAVPRLAVVAAAIAAAVIAARPEPFIHAWSESRVARAIRTMTRN